MDLFNQQYGANLLPYDGEVEYLGVIFNAEEERLYFNKLYANIQWRHDQAMMFGKRITTKRKVAWYADQAYDYTYSNVTKQALPWTRELLEIKTIIEDRTKTGFNSCLLNLYEDGTEGMSWHSDDEKALGRNTTIASVSFGSARKFSLKHKVSRYKKDIILQSGSLLVMKGGTQTHWLHAVPKTKKVKSPRINLTFRTIKQQ